MTAKKAFKNFADYLEPQPEIAREALRELRALILEAVPDATETMTYNVPAFKLIEGAGMQEQIMIAAFKKHSGLYPHPTTIEHFAGELSAYKTAKGTVRFPLGEPLPRDLIIRMVRYRKGMVDASAGK
jgi:uncharacterized protein YdhG (YjbR/CyaY superfamily)